MKYKVGSIVNGMYGRIKIEGRNNYGYYYGRYTGIFNPLNMLKDGMATGPMTERHLDQYNMSRPCPMEVQHEIQKR